MKNSVYWWKGLLGRPLLPSPQSLAMLLVVILLMLVACSDDIQKPAPAGDHAVLEQLAQAYRTVGERYPMQPQAMPPSGRKDFLSKVFNQAGFSYSVTLLALGQPDASIANQDHRDLVELLLLPNKGLSDEDLSSIYSVDEQAAVRRLRVIFR